MGDSARPGAIALLKSNDGEEFTPWIVRVTEIQSCINFAAEFGVSLCADLFFSSGFIINAFIIYDSLASFT